jgi:hypothetical protein
VWIPEEKWSDVVKRAVREAKEMTHLGTHRVIEVWNDVYYVFWQGGQWYRDAYNGIVG